MQTINSSAMTSLVLGQVWTVISFNTVLSGGRFRMASLAFPPAESLVDARPKVYYYILADDVFPLRTWLIKPFCWKTFGIKECVFKYWINCWKSVGKNAFVILASRYRVLQYISSTAGA